MITDDRGQGSAAAAPPATLEGGGPERRGNGSGLAEQYAAGRLTDRHQQWLRLLEVLMVEEPASLSALPEPRHREQLQNSLNTQPFWQTVARDRLAQSRERSPFGAYPALATATMLARLVEGLADEPGDPDGEDHRELVGRCLGHLRRTGLAAAVPAEPATVESPPAGGAAGRPPRPLLAQLDTYPPGAETGFLRLLALELLHELPAAERVVAEPVVLHQDTLGRSGELTLKLLRSGPAGIYPDPSLMAFLNPDRSFLDSVAAAAAHLPPRLSGRCVVWSLTNKQRDPVNNVTGPSIGATFAVALASLGAPWPWRAAANRFALSHPRLARRTAITAELTGSELAAVSGHEHKVDAARAENVDLLVDDGSYHRARVHDQPLRDHARSRHVTLRHAATLPQARRRSAPRPTPAAWVALALVALVLVVTPLVALRLRAADPDVPEPPQASRAVTLAPRTVPSGPLVVDGVFGRATCAALQRALNDRYGADLDVDGAIGPLTLSALQEALGVRPVTGDRDKATVRALQRHVGAPVNGKWNSETIAKLQVALNEGRF